jgi:hypothetical protein
LCWRDQPRAAKQRCRWRWRTRWTAKSSPRTPCRRAPRARAWQRASKAAR